MNSIAAGWVKTSKRLRAGLAAGAAIAAVAAIAAAPAAAEAEMPLASPLAPSMTLSFAAGSARLVGGRAVVPVKCKGPQSGTCTGTVTLNVGGRDHQAAFSVIGGAKQSVVVPLGPVSPGSAKHRVRAVAKTVQDLGACHETERFLRLG